MSFRLVECFLSGGRDSALACYIAYEYAKEHGLEFRLVFLDTGTGLRTTLNYIREYARWLNAQLHVVRTPYDYWELVKKWGYPMLKKLRWCMEFLKLAPLSILAREEVSAGYGAQDVLWVMGIRRDESLFRLANYTSEWYVHTHVLSHLHPGGLQVFTRRYWCPLLNVNGQTRNSLLSRYGIPRNPAWCTGISGECLCMAGTTRKNLDRLILFMREHEPDTLEKLAQMDIEVQQCRRKQEPLLPAPLRYVRKPLHEYIQEVIKQKTLLSVRA